MSHLLIPHLRESRENYSSAISASRVSGSERAVSKTVKQTCSPYFWRIEFLCFLLESKEEYPIYPVNPV